MWKGIREANEWYLGESFLLPKHTFDNPTRLSETSLRAYWKHWYNLSQSGQPFTFKRTGAHDVDARSDSGEPQGELPKEDMSEEETKGRSSGKEEEEEEAKGRSSGKGEEEEETKGKSSGEEEEEEVDGLPGKSDAEDGNKHPDSHGALTPDQCHSFGQKIIFLRTLASSDNAGYKDIISILAQMEVSPNLLLVASG